jgi:hypothetical protein
MEPTPRQEVHPTGLYCCECARARARALARLRGPTDDVGQGTERESERVVEDKRRGRSARPVLGHSSRGFGLDVSPGAALRRPEERWLRVKILETREQHRRACSPTDIVRPEISLLGGVHQMLTRRGVWQPGQSGNPKGCPSIKGPVEILAREHTEEAVRTP